MSSARYVEWVEAPVAWMLRIAVTVHIIRRSAGWHRAAGLRRRCARDGPCAV